MSVRVFYALNGLKFDYDRTMKDVLKELATDEATVDGDTVISYFTDHTRPLESEYDATIHLWRSLIDEHK